MKIMPVMQAIPQTQTQQPQQRAGNKKAAFGYFIASVDGSRDPELFLKIIQGLPKNEHLSKYLANLNISNLSAEIEPEFDLLQAGNMFNAQYSKNTNLFGVLFQSLDKATERDFSTKFRKVFKERALKKSPCTN